VTKAPKISNNAGEIFRATAQQSYFSLSGTSSRRCQYSWAWLNFKLELLSLGDLSYDFFPEISYLVFPPSEYIDADARLHLAEAHAFGGGIVVCVTGGQPEGTTMRI
jgi:hypothetical protein